MKEFNLLVVSSPKIALCFKCWTPGQTGQGRASLWVRDPGSRLTPGWGAMDFHGDLTVLQVNQFFSQIPLLT